MQTIADTAPAGSPGLNTTGSVGIWLARLGPFLGLALVTFLWWDNWIISALLFVISVPMPWIAVMFANAQGEPRDRRAPRVYKPGVVRHMETERQLAEARQAEAGELLGDGVVAELGAERALFGAWLTTLAVIRVVSISLERTEAEVAEEIVAAVEAF